MLRSEVRSAIKDIAAGKTSGADGIPIELIKELGENAIPILTDLCNKIWRQNSWPEDWKKSIYLPLPKKGDTTVCANNRTITLISHCSKILLKIIQRRMEQIISRELPQEQAGFRRGRGTRDHIANLRWIGEKAKEFQKKLYMCFIDYSKAFDCVNHDRLWLTLRGMGVPEHLTVLLHNLYDDQKAVVLTEWGETESFDIGEGVR